MSYKTFRILQGSIALAIGAVVAVSVIFDNWIIPLIGILAGSITLLFVRRNVREIVTDERTYTISGKASRLTLGIAIMGAALAGVILLALSRNGSDTLFQTGIGLAFGACALMIINSLAYNYYSSKTGGR